MKYLMLIVLLFSGCANMKTRDEMQADHSYRIVVKGSALASAEQKREEALSRATQLCPKGFKETGTVLEDTLIAAYTLIVMCNS